MFVSPVQSLTVVDRPGGYLLESFCSRLQETFSASDGQAPTPEHVAEELRQHYALSVPIRSQLSTLLAKLGISLVIRSFPSCDERRLRGYNHYHHQKGKWEVVVPPDAGYNEAVTISHELYEIIYARCLHRIPWWKDRMSNQRLYGPHDGADRFAFALEPV